MPKIKPRSWRRPPPLGDSSYDHAIDLVDHSLSTEQAVPLSSEDTALGLRSSQSTTAPLVQNEPPSSPRPPPPLARGSLRNEGGEEEEEEDEEDEDEDGNDYHSSPERSRSSQSRPRPAVEIDEPTPMEHPHVDSTPKKPSRVSAREREAAIEILYQNERGAFLCGIPLFSAQALGNLDPPAWTNAAHKTSPTDIHTAQVPDPSWEWAWPEWRVNHDADAEEDDDGWEYSFMFARQFSWHGPTWWSSFVRRRAWIRKRVKKAEETAVLAGADPRLLGPDYFTVHPASEEGAGISHRGSGSHYSLSKASSRRDSRASPSQLSSGTGASRASSTHERPAVIEDMETLLHKLRRSRIDREKIEAVENYLAHGDEDLVHLQDEMHEIMALFVFQASRRVMLTGLAHAHGETLAQKKTEPTPELERREEFLAAAIWHADEEVRRLEYWSDVKEMVAEGESRGAQDENQGWGAVGWKGVDQSGPAEPGPQPEKKED